MLRENHIQPIILSGGSGTRLWPLSRKSLPKQYIHLGSLDKYSPLQETQKRLLGIRNLEDPIIICNEDQRFIAAEQMREIKIHPKAIILEPTSRNTAPAVAIGALKALEKGDDPIVLILSSDHKIKDAEKFRKVIEASLPVAEQGNLVVFGVTPTRPETGYGYIEASKVVDFKSLQTVPIKSFIEKPDKKKAEILIKDDKYLWNSGIFLCKANFIINELKIYEPKLLDLCKKSLKRSKDLDFQRLEIKHFENCPNLSVDYAVMEKTTKAHVMPLDVGWSDFGNWQSLWEIEEKDKQGNTKIGDVKAKKIKNCYLNSENKLLVTIGTENLIVVQTKDATLVCDQKEAQEIKDIVQQLILEGRSEVESHRKVFRPWGYFNTIERTGFWQVKEIIVNPKSSLSLQKHEFRSEHWIILKGKADIQINDSKMQLIEGQSSYIPVGAKHRLSNSQDMPLLLIEVQCGSYLGEDDIQRFEDNYGRNLIK